MVGAQVAEVFQLGIKGRQMRCHLNPAIVTLSVLSRSGEMGETASPLFIHMSTSTMTEEM
jgi:hypothetical protein